jgi:hypothetical protein
MSRWVAYFFGLILTLVILALALVETLYFWRVRPAIRTAREIQAKHVKPFLNDQAALAKVEFIQTTLLSEKPRTSDASAVLNPKLFWAPRPANFKFKSPTAPRPLVSIDARERVIRLRGEWMERHLLAQHLEADLSFFDEVFKFDHWDLENASPIADLTQADRFVPPPSLPIPEVNDLLAAAKLRLMHGAMERKALKALEEVRQFARLLMTTENMHLVLAGISILDDERFAYRYYVNTGLLHGMAWMPIDRNTTLRAHRSILANRNFLRLWTDPDITRRLYLEGPLPVGSCAVMNEALPLEFALRKNLEPQLPLELDLRDEYKRLDEILSRAQSTCRLRYLTQLARTKNFRVEIPGPLFLNHLPYTRKVFGLRLSSLSFTEFR